MDHRPEFDTSWRRAASAIYKRPVDSKIFGSVEIDVTELEAYITAKRKQGLKITMTHVLTLAVSRALKEAVPELNCYIRRGKVVHREHIDATVSVLMDGGKQMGSVLVKDADRLSLAELVDFMKTEIAKSRSGAENKLMQKKNFLAVIPWPFRSWVFWLVRKITMDLGFSIPILGITAHSFGSFILSNIGSIGLDLGYPALFPSSNMAFVIIMGGLNTKPGVVNNEILPRRILNLGAALDHRVVDAVHGGKLFGFLKQILKTPELLESPPAWVENSTA